VLAREHPLLLETLRTIASGALDLQAAPVRMNGQPLAAPLQLAANNRFA